MTVIKRANKERVTNILFGDAVIAMYIRMYGAGGGI